MVKKLFNERKTVKIYLGKITWLHLVKAAGGKGKVSKYIRDMIEREIY